MGRKTFSYLPRQLGAQFHFWPFDGWSAPTGVSVIAEVYPALWRRGYPAEDRNSHQHDAYAAARWMREQDASGALSASFQPALPPAQLSQAQVEGWILGLA